MATREAQLGSRCARRGELLIVVRDADGKTGFVVRDGIMIEHVVLPYNSEVRLEDVSLVESPRRKSKDTHVLATFRQVQISKVHSDEVFSLHDGSYLLLRDMHEGLMLLVVQLGMKPREETKNGAPL